MSRPAPQADVAYASLVRALEASELRIRERLAHHTERRQRQAGPQQPPTGGRARERYDERACEHRGEGGLRLEEDEEPRGRAAGPARAQVGVAAFFRPRSGAPIDQI